MVLPNLSAESIKGLHEQASVALVQMLKLLPPVDRRKGVFLRLFILMNGVGGTADLLQLDECWVHGMTNLTERRRYMVFSNEKAFRLAEWFRNDRSIRSSYQAGRDRGKDHYAGAVLVRCMVPELGPAPAWLIFSVSGLAEMEDEALALRLAAAMPWKASMHDITAAVVASKNSLAPRLLRAAA